MGTDGKKEGRTGKQTDGRKQNFLMMLHMTLRSKRRIFCISSFRCFFWSSADIRFKFRFVFKTVGVFHVIKHSYISIFQLPIVINTF